MAGKTGTEEYDDSIKKNIQKLIDDYRDTIYYLEGFADYASSSHSLNTTVNWVRYVTMFIRDTNYTRPSSLNLNHYTKFMNKAKEKTPNHANMAYYALKNLSEYFYISKMSTENYMKYIKKPKFYDTPEAKEKRNNGFLTVDECKQLLTNLKNNAYDEEGNIRNWIAVRDYALVVIFLTTGIRCAAMYKLDLNNVDLEERKIVIREKGDKIITYNIGDEAYKCLNDYIEARMKAVKIKFLYNKDKYDIPALFISVRFDRLGKTGLSKVIYESTAKVTNKVISPHKLRATFCTMLYDQTKDLYFVQKCMHHSDPSTTERYIRTKEDQTKKGTEITNNIFFGNGDDDDERSEKLEKII